MLKVLWLLLLLLPSPALAQTLTQPVPGSTITTTSVTVQWTPVAGATNYFIGVGTSLNSVNADPWGNLFNGYRFPATSVTVNNIPLGNPVYVRLWWTTDNQATWQSVTYTYQTVAPAPLCNRVFWTANTESDLAGYYVYVAKDGVDLPRKTVSEPTTEITCLAAKILQGAAYVIHLTAVDTSGNESLKSVALSAGAVPDTTPPAVPKNPQLIQ